MGLKNTKYYNDLRRIRPSIEFANERILCFQKEVERHSVKETDKEVVITALTAAIGKLSEILYASYDIYGQERDSIRTMKVRSYQGGARGT